MNKVFYAGNTSFEAFVWEILNMPINLLLALYLVYSRYFFNMGPAYMFSHGVETLRIDGYLALIILTHGELTKFYRLMKYGEPLSVRKAHPSPETYSYKCAAVLKTLLVEYLLMQNMHLTGEERSAKTGEEVRKANGGIPLLTVLCLALRSDPLGMIRSLGEVLTCVYGPAVTYSFPNPRLAVYRHSVVHVSLISVPDGTALNLCRQEDLRARMTETVLFGKIKDPELIVLNFRGQLQCRMGGKREDPIEVYPKFGSLNSVAKDTIEVLRIAAWPKSFKFTKRELETILERNVLPTEIPEFPTESNGGAAAEYVHRQLGPLVHRVFGSAIYPYL